MKKFITILLSIQVAFGLFFGTLFVMLPATVTVNANAVGVLVLGVSSTFVGILLSLRYFYEAYQMRWAFEEGKELVCSAETWWERIENRA